MKGIISILLKPRAEKWFNGEKMQQKRVNSMVNLVRAMVVISLIVHLGWNRSVSLRNAAGEPPLEMIAKGDAATLLAGGEESARTQLAESVLTISRWKPAFSVGRLGVQF